MSLYANLLKKGNAATSSPATISSEPVKYSFKKAEDETKEVSKTPDASLRFQPSVKRPQAQQAKVKPRPGPSHSSSSPDKQLPPTERKPPSAPVTAGAGESIENWIDEDADDYYVAEYTRHKQEQKERQREAKKKRKKNHSQAQESREVNWDAIYDPEQPVRLDDYKGSLEELDAKYEWKQRLHAHQRKKNRPEPDTRASSEQQDSKFRAFAPPSNYDFAPPKEESDSGPAPVFAPALAPALAPTSASATGNGEEEDEDYEPPPPVFVSPPTHLPSTVPPPPFDPPSVQPPQIPGRPFPPHAMPFPPGPWQFTPGAAPPLPPGIQFPPPPPPQMQFPTPPSAMQFPTPPSAMQFPTPPSGLQFAPPPPGLPFAPPPQFLAPQSIQSPIPNPTPPAPTPSTLPAAPTPPVQSSAVISRAPVRYTQPSPQAQDGEEEPQSQGGLGFSAKPDDLEPEPAAESDEDQPRSNRPGQKGFAKRLLQKYGWKEGEGLGASGTGITTILQHQTQKRKKKPDAEGGGWAQPAAMGRIVGGKRRKTDNPDDESESWSIVARFDGMLSGLDIDQEMMEGDLMQKMGEKMAEYGHVERLYIHRPAVGNEPVFVKFTSALSAYRAIQASNDQDFLDNGRTVKSAFWSEEKFAQDVYE